MTPEDAKQWFHNAQFGFMSHYLLNSGPDHLGRLPGDAVRILAEVGRLSGL